MVFKCLGSFFDNQLKGRCAQDGEASIMPGPEGPGSQAEAPKGLKRALQRSSATKKLSQNVNQGVILNSFTASVASLVSGSHRGCCRRLEILKQVQNDIFLY